MQDRIAEGDVTPCHEYDCKSDPAMAADVNAALWEVSTIFPYYEQSNLINAEFS